MKKLYVGLKRNIELPKGGFLYIDDEIPSLSRARPFDPSKHSFNPLKGLGYKQAREIAEILYTVNPQGENTLTVRNGKRGLLKALLGEKRWGKKPRFLNQLSGDEEVVGTVEDFFSSPVLKRALCQPTNFSFNPNSIILARINRAELGEFDALALGLFLISNFKGQIVVPDLGFYGRDIHTSLVRQNRLIAGVNFLGELPVKLRNECLLMKEKIASGTTFADAETLALFARLEPRTNEYNDFIHGAMS